MENKFLVVVRSSEAGVVSKAVYEYELAKTLEWAERTGQKMKARFTVKKYPVDYVDNDGIEEAIIVSNW